MTGRGLLKTTFFAGSLLLAGTALLTMPAILSPGDYAALAEHSGDHATQEHASHDQGKGHGHGTDQDAGHGHKDDHASGHGHDHGDGGAAGHGGRKGHDKGHGQTHAAHGDHGNIVHGNIEDYPGQKRKVAQYAAPSVTLRNHKDEPVRLDEILAEDKPAVLQFIFTTCTTLCPVLTATLSQAETDIVAADSDVQLISISIDPQHDTPRRLKEYAGMYGAGDNWTFLTGGRDEIMKVLRAFDAVFESDNKMYHQPYTYMRSGADRPWLRIEAILSANELIGAYRQVQEAGLQVNSAVEMN